MATGAMFVALGGGAYAAATIDSGDVANDSLKSVDLKNGDGVRSADVRDDSLAGGGLTEADIANDAVTSSEVVNGSLTGDDIDESSLQVEGDGGFTQAIVRIADASNVVQGQNYRYANPRCQPGETATGGGWQNGSGVAFANYPTVGDPIAPGVGNTAFPGDTADGWFVMLQGVGTFTAFVVCES